MFVPPQIFRTDDYFQQQSVGSATSECTVGFSNGTVASTCNSYGPDVPCVTSTDPLEPVLEADIRELTLTSCSESILVVEVPKIDSSHASVMINDMQPLNDSS